MGLRSSVSVSLRIGFRSWSISLLLTPILSFQSKSTKCSGRIFPPLSGIMMTISSRRYESKGKKVFLLLKPPRDKVKQSKRQKKKDRDTQRERERQRERVLLPFPS